MAEVRYTAHMLKKPKPINVAMWTFGVYGTLMAAWTLAWLVKVNLDPQNGWLAAGAGSFTYWTIAKILIWILPAIVLIRLSGRSVRQVVNLSNWRKWLKWGGGIGLLIALTGFIPKYVSGQPLLPVEMSHALFSVLIVAPLFEEFLMRGAILGNLQQRYSFWRANLLSSLMFLGLHLPGWYFLGGLMENLTKPIGGAISIVALGLAFGYAVHRGRSVMGGVLAHFLNNLSSLR
jgi:uncharacterized protein